MTRTLGCALLLSSSLAACGGDSSEKPEPSIEQALSHVVEGQEKMKAHSDDEAVGKMRKKAADEAAKAHQEAFDALLVVAADAPTKLADLCEQTAAAYDAYRGARLGGMELERWNAIKEPDINKLVKSCTASKNRQVWACKWGALRAAPPTFGDREADKILAGCEDKFGPKKADQ